MKLYKISWRDAAGYHRLFCSSIRQAELAAKAIAEGDPNCPLDKHQDWTPEAVEIPTDKIGLMNWLNANAANADSF